MEEIVNAISTVGFPIAISTYMIVVLNKSINTMNETLTKLTTLITKMESEDK